MPSLIGMLLNFLWWIGSGVIAFNIVEPHSFIAVLVFLVVWFALRYAVMLAAAAMLGAVVRASE